MTTPIFDMTEWAAAQASPWVPHNSALRLLEAVIRGTVADRDLTAPPGACADGAAYLVDAPATGAWAGHAGEMAVAVGVNAANGWLFAPVAQEGFVLYVADEDVRLEYRTDTSPEGWVGLLPYDFGFVFETSPDPGAVLGRVRIGRDIRIPPDFGGSFGGGDVNPAADYAIDVQDDGVSIGTITVSNAGAITWQTVGNVLKDVAAGSEILFLAPNASPPDGTIAGWSFVILALQE